MTAEDPTFFQRLTRQQNPQYLWIGCSDSRVPANEIVDLLPGELFVHRNVGNVVVHTDLNCLSVLQYAVEVLDVTRIIVCGHYGCGGIAAAYRDKPLGLIDSWLRHIQDVHTRHTEQLTALPDDRARLDRLCELNVVEQAMNVCKTSTVRRAWQEGHTLAVMAWIYSLEDGILRDLGFSASNPEEAATSYQTAVQPKKPAGP